MDLTRKPFEASDRKKRTEKGFSTLHKDTVERKDFESNKLIFPLQTVRIKLNKTWKKVFRSKLLELCKTGTKKSSPDVFNFYVVLVGQDMVTDASRATTCRRKFKAPSLQTKSTKHEGPPENIGFKGKTVWRFQTKKKQIHYSRPFKTTPWKTRTLNASIEHGPRRQ